MIKIKEGKLNVVLNEQIVLEPVLCFRESSGGKMNVLKNSLVEANA